MDPLYNKRLETNLLFGRGYRAGIDPREQRKKNTFLEALTYKRQVCLLSRLHLSVIWALTARPFNQEEYRKLDATNEDLSYEEKKLREQARQKQMEAVRMQEDLIQDAMAAKV